MYEHLEPLKQKLLLLSISTPPFPWKFVASVAIGGLRSVGFDRNSDSLLVVSSQGRGVLDCITGTKTARDYNEYYKNEVCLEAEGIGTLSNKIIRMSGLFGGGLPVSTEDGWRLESITLRWPEQMIILIPPDSSIYDNPSSYPNTITKVAEELCIMAYGFSNTGQSLIVATTSEINIFNRVAL
ncbi:MULTISPECIES: hypothetical protein [Cyanophyceae]|jgi:hypothetical protein|uniref:Uncharacterized protein n=2 Tax=Cyanophyceae TaxID=3028117 RepID=A0ABU5TQS7_9CYAN|nr:MULTISPECIES: hypothetical protein [Cyanophyceae]MBD2319250.1 hypothetical protein [Phormidium tenue FACHB-1050]MEA5479848.1 hypothetical protein [Pseudanabaena galeata UHCC 0370]